MSKFEPKSPKGSVPNDQSSIVMCYAIKWFKCKLKPPKKQMIQKIKKFGDAGKHTQLLKEIVNTI